MPSHRHESHLLLFRNRPTLAAELLQRALGVTLPEFREAQVVSADLTDIQPAEYRADMVIELSADAPVYGLIVEVQLSPDERKRYVWPAYVANLRARLECPVSLLVVTADEAVARWAAREVEMGGRYRFAPYVLGPSGVPEVTDEMLAREHPELAVLSAMAHGLDEDVDTAIEIARVAQKASFALDAERAKIYGDLILSSLGEAARQALMTMDARTYEYQSDFIRQYIALGREEGRAEGRAALITRLLTLRFGPIDSETQGRVQRASVAELEAMVERALSARSLAEALGPA